MLAHLKSSPKSAAAMKRKAVVGVTPLVSPARESSLSSKSTLLLAPESTLPPQLFPGNSGVASSWGRGREGGRTDEGMGDTQLRGMGGIVGGFTLGRGC